MEETDLEFSSFNCSEPGKRGEIHAADSQTQHFQVTENS